MKLRRRWIILGAAAALAAVTFAAWYVWRPQHRARRLVAEIARYGQPPSRAEQWLIRLGLAKRPGTRRPASIAWELATIGEPAVGPLTRGLRHQNRDVRIWSAHALGRMGPPARGAVAALADALGDANAAVREQAAYALGKIRCPDDQAIAALARSLKDPLRDVRIRSAWALGEIGPAAKQAVPSLLQPLSDPKSGCASAAARALAQIRPTDEKAILGLCAALNDQEFGPASGYVSHWAAEALTSIGPPAVPALIRTLEKEDASGEATYKACQVLGRIGPLAKDAIPALTQVLGDERPWVRGSAAQALGKIRGQGD